LRADVDAALAEHGQLDESKVSAFFRRHVAEIDPQAARKVADGFQRVLSGMAESAAQAGDQTARFGSSLSRLSARLSEEDTLLEVLEDTRRMSQAMLALQQRLAESQREISALREEVRRARDESLLDGLSGLANRRAFDQRLATALVEALAGGSQACQLVSDIDHFKKVNDSFGHGFGDQVLRAVAQVLKACAPSEGMAARLGGEEFAILLPRSALPEAQAIAERMRVAIAGSRIRRQSDASVLAQVTVSVGVTLHRVGESAREFLERADRALYAAKSAGRDRVTVMTA
jgi:diguanylate cyclase